MPKVDAAIIRQFRAAIAKGEDPLGDAFCAIRPREVRRAVGATYTPSPIVKAMLDWCSIAIPQQPGRVVDPGCGSARFLIDAGRRFPKATLLGIEIDPVAAIIARGNLAARGLETRSEVRLADFRDAQLKEIEGRTLFVGNPPYVRHHQIAQKWKAWLTQTAASLGLPASQLCGLHLHFYLATALLGKPGDYGAYITAAEWLDVNYGALLRKLAVRQLGVRMLTLIEPTAQPFPDAATTASIASFVLGHKAKTVSFYRVASTAALEKLIEPKQVSVERLEAEPRWTVFTRATQKVPKGYVELGELCRVHRGQVTGANGVWVVGADAGLPGHVLFPAITRAKELFNAGQKLVDSSHLRCVVDLPVDLDELEKADRRLVDAFLRMAKAKGADKGYVAENRKCWWAVGLRAPAPILCTYMARRPPAFVENGVDARHINIAHGLYPRESLAKATMRKLIGFLSTKVSINLGRTYAGGLTKFEPGEIERIPVPEIELLQQMDV
ncbi:MAG TPA: N-6 DNA methylase [Planctomycetaceae bacterium]|nr:N-6 DNA methylase [Planctomycetaceae bacterium]